MENGDEDEYGENIVDRSSFIYLCGHVVKMQMTIKKQQNWIVSNVDRIFHVAILSSFN